MVNHVESAEALKKKRLIFRPWICHFKIGIVIWMKWFGKVVFLFIIIHDSSN